jgi:hypothetical protein
MTRQPPGFDQAAHMLSRKTEEPGSCVYIHKWFKLSSF